jgi:hypothetical protein
MDCQCHLFFFKKNPIMSLYPEITDAVPSLYERCSALITEREYLRDIARTLAAKVHQNIAIAKTHLEDMASKLRESTMMREQAEQDREQLKSLNDFLQERLRTEIAEKGHLYTRFMELIPRFQSEKDDDMLRIAELENQLAAKTLLLETICVDLRANEASRLVDTFVVPETVSEASQTERSCTLTPLDARSFTFDSDAEIVLHQEEPAVELFLDTSNLQDVPDAGIEYCQKSSVEFFPDSMDMKMPDVVEMNHHEQSAVESESPEVVVQFVNHEKSAVDKPENPDTNLFMFDSNTVVLESSSAEVVSDMSPVDQLRSALAGKNNKDLNALTVAELTKYLSWIGKTYVKPKAKSISILLGAIAE